MGEPIDLNALLQKVERLERKNEESAKVAKASWRSFDAIIEALRQELRETRTLAFRDQFAMAALTGLCAHERYGQNDPESLATFAYEQADVMLAAREVKS